MDFYGPYGGAFIPEMLYPNVEELKNNYLEIINSLNFQNRIYRLCWQTMLADPVHYTLPVDFRKNTKQIFTSSVKI